MYDLRPIGHRSTLAEIAMDIKNKGWIFDGAVEKIILAICIGWTGYSIFRFLLVWWI